MLIFELELTVTENSKDCMTIGGLTWARIDRIGVKQYVRQWHREKLRCILSWY